jgi:hypothetical protein
MQDFKPIDFTRLCVDGQIKVVTIKEPARFIIKHSKAPYILLAVSLMALGGMAIYFKNLLDKKEEELKRLQHLNKLQKTNIV